MCSLEAHGRLPTGEKKRSWPNRDRSQVPTWKSLLISLWGGWHLCSTCRSCTVSGLSFIRTTWGFRKSHFTEKQTDLTEVTGSISRRRSQPSIYMAHENPVHTSVLHRTVAQVKWKHAQEGPPEETKRYPVLPNRSIMWAVDVFLNSETESLYLFTTFTHFCLCSNHYFWQPPIGFLNLRGFFVFSFHIEMKSYSVCLSLIWLISVSIWPQILSMLLQKVDFLLLMT